MEAKKAAGIRAVDFVEDGMRLGLGTGSTVAYFLDALGRAITQHGLRVHGIATSEDTARRARDAGIPLIAEDDLPPLDLAVDGADEIDARFRLIKGGGGALLREKVVAAAAKKVIIVVGEGKRVARLGKAFRLPVEVLPFGWTATARAVEAIGCTPFLRTLEDGSPSRTDNGNFILDCGFAEGIRRPEKLHADLSQIAGVAEVGLFLDHCDVVIEGNADGGTETHYRESKLAKHGE